jgi:hypothetical protein
MVAARLPALRPGDWVEVLPLAEILATLDPEGRLDGLPFMPEMARHAGHRYRVRQRAKRTCVHPPQIPFPRLDGCVTLSTLRCDGSAHGGCQLGCLIFWKESWLRRVGDGRDRAEPSPIEPSPIESSPIESSPTGLARLVAVTEDGTYRCQGTELTRATSPGGSLLGPWQYLGYLRDRTFTPRELVGMAARLGTRALLSAFRSRVPPADASPAPPLQLRPGEWVRVRRPEEIRATLDPSGKLAGLAFGADMVADCAKAFRVQQRVERVMDERTGRLRPVRNTVSLHGSVCDRYLGCARGMPILWREAWLERVGSADFARRPDHLGHRITDHRESAGET